MTKRDLIKSLAIMWGWWIVATSMLSYLAITVKEPHVALIMLLPLLISIIFSLQHIGSYRKMEELRALVRAAYSL